MMAKGLDKPRSNYFRNRATLPINGANSEGLALAGFQVSLSLSSSQKE